MPSAIEIVISARDDASRVLDNVHNRLVVFDQFGRVASDLTEKVDRTNQVIERIDLSASKASRGIRTLAVPIVAELSPALGQLGSQMAGVISTAALFGSGIGAAAIAAASLAGIVGGKLVDSFIQTRTEWEQFTRALGSSDLGRVTAEVERLHLKIRGLSEELSEMQRGEKTTPLLEIIGERLGFGRRARLNEALDQSARAREEQRRLRELETGAPGMTNAELNAILGANARETFAIQQGQRGLFDFLQSPIEQAFREAMRRAEDLERAGQPEAAARQRGAARERRFFDFAGTLGRDQVAPGEGFEAAIAGAPDVMTRIQIEARQANQAIEDLRASLERDVQGGQMETALVGVSPEERAAGEQRRKDALGAQAQLTAELLGLERRRLDLAGQLTPELSAQLTQLQAAAIASDQRLTPEQQALAIAQAQLAVWQDLAALDPLQGLITGFSRIANESRRLGAELERFAYETGSNMERAFSDTLFDAFTGKKGEDIGRRFGESMLRSFTDLLGRQMSGAVAGLFASALRGFVPGVSGGGFTGGGGGGVLELLGSLVGAATGGSGGPVISPTGQPTGTLIVTAGGQLAQVMPSGALQAAGGGLDTTQLLGLFSQTNTLSGLFNGPTLGVSGAGGYSAALSATPLSSLAGSGVAAVQTTLIGQQLGFYTAGGGLVQGGGLTGAAAGQGFEAAIAGSQAGNYSGATVGTTAGSTVGAAATGVLAGVALGFTIYAGLSQEPTATNIAINTISGAVSGAILGAVIGLAVTGGNPVGGLVGGVIGAVAGGAAAGGTTGLKAPKGMSTSEKSRRIGEAAANNFVGALRRAASLEDLAVIFNTRWAPHGEVQILTTYQGLTYWAGDYDDPAGAAATAELMAIPEFLDNLVIYVGESGAPQLRQDLVDEFKAKRDELLGILREVPIVVLESDRAAGVSRRTYQPFTTLYGMPRGTQAVAGSSELFRRDLGADDDTIAFLIQRIREVSLRKDIDLSREDFLFR